MISEEKIIKKLKELLERAVKESCSEEKTGVIFSGGLDSSIIGILAKNYSEIIAYTVGSEGSVDLEFVENLKDKNEVNFEIKTKRIAQEEVEKNLPKILSIVKDTNPTQVSCAIPIYFASEEAKKDGLKVILTGQGGDELFGGYNRYLNCLENEKELTKILKKDVENSYEDNLNRDIEVCRSNGIKLKIPYLEKDFKNFALEVPIGLKIRKIKESEEVPYSCVDEVNEKKVIRKYILREVAKEIEVPEVILNRKKKALQYGSGSLKILKKIAKGRGFRGRSYIVKYLESLLEIKNIN